MKNKAFLETTIQIERNFSNAPVRNSINNKLKDTELLSSSYVFGEMKFNLLRNAITLYNLVQECETTNEALDRLSSVAYSTGQYARIIKVFSFLTEDGKMDKLNVQKRLNMFIEDIFESRFSRNLTMPLLDEAKCLRARVNPYYEDGLWNIRFSCNLKMKEKCNICNFIDINLENFKLIESINNDESTHESNISDIIKILKEIREDKKEPYGKRCWKIGDAIIGSEVPENSILYTTNVKDYEPICKKLNKEMVKVNTVI